MRTSLGFRLFASLAGTVLAAWLATAAFSYLDARDRIGEMLDEHLVQAATLVLEGGAGAQGVRHPSHWGPHSEGHSLVYQGWSADGRLLFRSEDAPSVALSEKQEGFSEVERGGKRWRVFGSRAEPGGLLVQVAEHAEFRGELAASVARHLLHPLAIALPVLALLIWLSVRWGLRPLRTLASEVSRREPSSVAALDVPGAPEEARPLVAALEALFVRLAASVESERRFTADAAHELRTPLAAIQTHAEVALATRDDAERTRSLSRVIEGISRANGLVSQLLVLARLDARSAPLPLQPISLPELAARQIAEAAPAASRKGINLGLVDPAQHEQLLAPGDADLLGILLRNLVDNAIRYTPAGGRVDVSVRREGSRVLLRVADDGPGVFPEERAYLLQRFYRGRQTGEDGSGLGLSIVSRIAELHGAELSFDQGLDGRGLSVVVALPGALAP